MVTHSVFVIPFLIVLCSTLVIGLTEMHSLFTLMLCSDVTLTGDRKQYNYSTEKMRNARGVGAASFLCTEVVREV